MRRFGRFELRALLSKSARSLIWRVHDPRGGLELVICMPRAQPNSAAALAHWMGMAQGGSRVEHPCIAPVFEVGQVDGWPFVAYDRALGETLEERLARQAAPLPLDAAHWIGQFLEGLAFAHEAGHAHRDIQLGNLLINDQNKVVLIGLEVAQEVFPATVDFNTVTRRAVRESAQEDVLCAGLLLHRVLSGRPVLDEPDIQKVVQQMQPLGREVVRLGWETSHPIADPLRAICNRATDRQARQRYHLARSFLRALDGWRLAASLETGGAVALLLDRLQRVGHLPSTSSGIHRLTAGGSGLESQHARELSEVVLKDMALSLEMIKRVNNSMRQSGYSSGEGGETVLTMQRAIAMLGLNGVQQAANALKPWPGPLQPAAAELLRQLMARVHKAGQVAQALRPAGYDAGVVYLVTVMQNLGRLLLQYHFPDDAQQIRQLMVPADPTEDQPNPVSMSEQAAAYAVLGCDLEALGSAVTRYWGLGDDLLQMVRRPALDGAIHASRSDTDQIRLTAGLANELVDALQLPEARRKLGIEVATRRYAKALGLGLRDVMEAINPGQAARPRTAGAAPDSAPTPAPGSAPAPAASPASAAQPAPSATDATQASALRSRVAARAASGTGR